MCPEIQMYHLWKESPTLSEKILRTSEVWSLAIGESKGNVSRVCRQELTKQFWEITVFEGDLEGHDISCLLGGKE